MRKIYSIGVALILLASCRPSININKDATAGNAEFTNYLAIGNSLTAGYTDGSLTVTGQLNSYPKMLFDQFSMIKVHGAVGKFIQPLLTSDNGYPGPKYILAMTYNPCNPADSSLGPVPYPYPLNNSADATYSATVNNGQINNIAVPGIRAADYKVAGYAQFAAAGNAPYALRFYNNPGTASPNDELLFMVHNLHPTFFTMWLGSNDVLLYATKGGQGIGDGTATPAFGNFYNPADITPVSAFDSCYDLALNSAISTGASGALINIPDITSIPFFTTIPANGMTLLRQGQADTLKGYYASKGITTSFEVGSNYFMIQDHKGLTRQAVPGELILLTCPKDSITCRGWGTTKPIPDSLVLTTDEIQNVQKAVIAYNAFIKQEADLHHLAYVDMNTYFSKMPAGITYNGITYSTSFVTGGAFSLDGVHPTQRGYALIANEIIRTINAFYKSNITSLDVNKYNGVTYP